MKLNARGIVALITMPPYTHVDTLPRHSSSREQRTASSRLFTVAEDLTVEQDEQTEITPLSDFENGARQEELIRHIRARHVRIYYAADAALRPLLLVAEPRMLPTSLHKCRASDDLMCCPLEMHFPYTPAFVFGPVMRTV
jgi:hypothetical protein